MILKLFCKKVLSKEIKTIHIFTGVPSNIPKKWNIYVKFKINAKRNANGNTRKKHFWMSLNLSAQNFCHYKINKSLYKCIQMNSISHFSVCFLQSF